LRIAKNKNFIIVVLGSTSSGKSWLCLFLGEQWNPEFSIKQVCFTPMELMHIINAHMAGTEILSPGSVLVVEEAGVQFSAREWMHAINRAIGKLAQSFRSLNVILICNLPCFADLDKQVRNLTHLVLEAQDKIDFKNGLSYFTIREIRVDHFTGEIKRFPPLWLKKDGTVSRMGTMVAKKPSENLCKEYEQKKKDWQTVEYVQLGTDIELSEMKHTENFLKKQLKLEKLRGRLIGDEEVYKVKGKTYSGEPDGRSSDIRRETNRQKMKAYWVKKHAEQAAKTDAQPIVDSQTTTQQ
jgi:hypothetical protein